MDAKPAHAQNATLDHAVAHGRRLLAAQPALAEAQARAIVAADAHHAAGLRLLGAALRAQARDDAALAAEAQAIAAARFDPELIRAGAALVANDLPAAELILRQRLKADPFDVPAIRMMAELAARVGRVADSEHLLRRALELAPGFDAARANLATLLYRQHRAADALALLDQLARDGDIAEAHQNLRAAALGRLGGYREAIAIYRDVLEGHPGQPKLWMSLAHLLKTVGDQAEAIDAYRHAIALAPSMGEAYWSLANLKTVEFSAADIAAMEAALDATRQGGRALDPDDRLHLHFALGKAHEDRAADEAAWAHYAAGNAQRSAELGHDPARVTALVDRTIALLDAPFFAAHAGHGYSAPDPIFILGMPRAGSTLVEQILASHPLVEGTMELPDLTAIVRALGGDDRTYPDILTDLDPAALADLGRDYVARTRIHRQTDKPFFIDKMPNNWAYAGFIRLILPKAKIIDARRHPLACGFSNFKQHFARGQAFSYDLAHFGHYYADYVRLMAHFDRVEPGMIHRVVHEHLVDDPETEVRALLAYLGLDFDPACLRSHENKRAVRTASSEQVRRPISREGLDQYKRFAAHLGPLTTALGPVLTGWNEGSLPSPEPM
ncbi:MAG: sulfotransferase [Sphingomonas bacterium]|nr:sulfotransferase [Sphingomonas bacterium]